MESFSNIVNSIRNLFLTGNEDNDDICIICKDNLPNITFYPCKHDNCCERCYLQLTTKNCPYCRTKIEKTSNETDVPFPSNLPFDNLRLSEWLNSLPSTEHNIMTDIMTEEELDNMTVEEHDNYYDYIARELEEHDNMREELNNYYDYQAWQASFF